AEGLFIDGVVAGTKNLTHIVLAAPDLRHATVDIEQRVDRLHTGTHGILGGEDGVPRSFGKLADEGKVHGAVGYNFRAIRFLARLEKGVNIRHETGSRVAGIVCQRVDLFSRYADVVQPLTA